MSTTHNLCIPSRLTWQFLIAISTVTLMGCQSAAYRRHLPSWARPQSSRAHTCAPYNAYGSVQTPSASDRQQFNAGTQAPEQSIPPAEAVSTIVSDTDAIEMFRQMRGKLRADDNGAVVEADLSYSDVTDEALASIEIFQEIKELDLTGTQVHDESLIVLKQLPKLQSLKLKGTQLSSLGMTSLTQIPTLVLLDASNTAIADDGLTQASLWTSLRYLSLNNTSVTDAAIPYLTTVKTLKGLSLLNTSVTADGARTLKEALPDCLIVVKTEAEPGPSAAVDPLRPVPTQSGVAFPSFLSTSDPQLEQLVELAGKQPQLAVHLASVYSNREQWPQAAHVLAAAVAVDPSIQSAQFSLGVALARSGDIAAARMHLTQAVGEAAANYNLGQIEYENSLRSCAGHFRQAVSADPTLTIAQTRLQQVQQELETLKLQRLPVQSASYSSRPLADAPFEVIPAPPVRPATLSHSWPR